jgi:hypothetical protein
MTAGKQKISSDPKGWGLGEEDFGQKGGGGILAVAARHLAHAEVEGDEVVHLIGLDFELPDHQLHDLVRDVVDGVS